MLPIFLSKSFDEFYYLNFFLSFLQCEGLLAAPATQMQCFVFLKFSLFKNPGLIIFGSAKVSSASAMDACENIYDVEHE